ncbi:heparinase II/III family protein [Bacteroides sp.]|uniref:heparinase II/III domain-containing protein n=1 Tax=Bacteroides sp. TaxID=29523 RepID=UPI001B7686CD|nr:heparinase II/III family protein [Bacteroides sp.]MBP8622735.1 heparinase II/III family protein [Bacteroides sp.]
MKVLHTILFALLCFCSVEASAYSDKNLLQQAADIQRLKAALVPQQKWVNYPLYTDRAGWDKLFADTKQEYIKRGEQQLNYEWKVVKAMDYVEFERSGSRQVMEKPFGDNNTAMVDLLMAELAEGKGRFVPQLINGVFHTCEMTSWALSAHLVTQKIHRSLPDHREQLIDLTSGDLSSLLAWTYYLLHSEFDKVNPGIAVRLRYEVEKRTLEPYMNEANYYWWQAFRATPTTMVNNWNPWCNSNVLQCLMLLENDPEKLAAGVYRTMQSVDRFLNYVHADGACEEGPSYWGHAGGKLFDYLDLLSSITAGKVSLFTHPMIKNIGEYISRSYVGDGWVVNFADASAKGGGDAPLIYRFGKAVGSEEMMQFAALLNDNKLPRNRDFYRTLQTLTVRQALAETTPKHTTPLHTWYPETAFCYMKNKSGLFFAAKGGYNDESHNHNDAGSFSVWINNRPILIDAGVGTYTRQTFSSERYSIWTMQSDYHNLPMINGIAQKHGRKYKATQVKYDPKKNAFAANIATAYPENAKVKSWVRAYTLKGNSLQISDKFQLDEALEANTIHFMTWGKVALAAPGKISIEVNGQKALLAYNPSVFDATIEPVSLTDPRLTRVWGEQIYRVALKAKALTKTGDYSYSIIQQ